MWLIAWNSSCLLKKLLWFENCWADVLLLYNVKLVASQIFFSQLLSSTDIHPVLAALLRECRAPWVSAALDWCKSLCVWETGITPLPRHHHYSHSSKCCDSVNIHQPLTVTDSKHITQQTPNYKQSQDRRVQEGGRDFVRKETCWWK